MAWRRLGRDSAHRRALMRNLVCRCLGWWWACPQMPVLTLLLSCRRFCVARGSGSLGNMACLWLLLLPSNKASHHANCAFLPF